MAHCFLGKDRTPRAYRLHRVILDAELADLYGVPTKRLNEQVKRNAERFTDDSCSGSPEPRPRP
jgi:hypothetical protein